MSMRDIKSISTPWAIVLLVVSPSRLVGHAVDHALRSQPSALTPEKEQDLRRHFSGQVLESITVVRSSLFKAFLIVVAAIVGSLVSAWLLHICSVSKSPTVNAWLQYGGIGILLWATLGRAESAIQTFDGGTLPERVDLWLYRGLYVLGSYALALSVAW